MPNIGDRFTPGPRLLQYGGEYGIDENMILTVIRTFTAGGGHSWVIADQTGREIRGHWAFEIEGFFIPYVDPGPASPERFIIWNASNNSVYKPESSRRDDLSWDEAVTTCRRAVSIKESRVLHIIPLRSVTKIDRDGTTDYRNGEQL